MTGMPRRGLLARVMSAVIGGRAYRALAMNEATVASAIPSMTYWGDGW